MAGSVIALLWVGLGSAAGGMVRVLVSSLVGRRAGERFPWGTLAVNVSGSFGIGMVAAAAAAHALPGGPSLWQAVVVGFFGGFTTVSSFSLQNLALAQAGAYRIVVGNVAASLGGGLLAVFLGYTAGMTAFR